MSDQQSYISVGNLLVPQVNGSVEIFSTSTNFPINLSHRLLPSKNKLIVKRESDRVSESLTNVAFKPNSVAVAVTRLQGPAASAGGTPEENEEMTEKKIGSFTDTSQLLKLSGTRTVSPMHGRLNSIRN